MKFSRKVVEEVEVAYVRISVPVRYDEEDIANDAPMRSGDVWAAIVDVNTGQIQDWPQGKILDLSVKVCDEGHYALLDAAQVEIAKHQNYYVPHCTVPGQYGDYIHLEIDATGTVTNWHPDGTFSGFQPDDD